MKHSLIGIAAAAALTLSGLAAAHDGRGNDDRRGGYSGQYGRVPAYVVRSWRRGDRLPAAYGSRGYVVNYPRYRLYAPPRGAQWVRVNDDLILAVLATGLVLDVIHDLRR